MPWTVTVTFDDGSLAVEHLDDPLNVLAYVQLSLGTHPPRRILIVNGPESSCPDHSARLAEARRRRRQRSSMVSPASSPRR